VSQELSFNINVIKTDVFKYLEKSLGLFDIIFADPPYNFEKHQLEDLVNLVFQHGWLKKEGYMVIEHTKDLNLSNLNQFEEARKYGSSVFSFFTTN